MARVERRRFLLAASGLAAATLAARARATGRVARVGWLGWVGGKGASPSPIPLEGLRAGLRKRGWAEGENLVIEARSGERGDARNLTLELLQAKVELIVAQGPMIFAARAVAGPIPLVFNINGDPVEARLVASLAHPGANLTGITALSADLSAKRLELLKEATPRIMRVAAIANQGHPGVKTEFDATHAAAKWLGLTLAWYPVYSVKDFGGVLDTIARDGAEGLVAVPDNLINDRARAIAEFAVRRGIPSVSGWSEFAEAGNLMSYGPLLRGFYSHLAMYVDKLLRGAKPSDLPVEQPTQFELVINARAAKALGLAVPRAMLLRADRVID